MGRDASRIALGLDTKLYLSDGIFAHIKYDTTHSENYLDHRGTAGITIAFLMRLRR